MVRPRSVRPLVVTAATAVASKFAEAEEKTAGGVLLTETSKEKPAVGTVIAVGPGALDKDGNRKPVSISPGSSVISSMASFVFSLPSSEINFKS